jgi:hypothetical protein
MHLQNSLEWPTDSRRSRKRAHGPGDGGSPDRSRPAIMTKPCATPVREDDSTLVRVLEAHVETLKAENEILRRRLAAAEARTAQETAKAEGAIAELSALIRIRASAAALGDGGSRQSRPRLAQAEWSPAAPHSS